MCKQLQSGEHRDAVLDLLRTAREPRSSKELWDEITLMNTRKPPVGFPQSLGVLTNLMLTMKMDGFVDNQGDKWLPLPPKPVKIERSLF